MCSLWVYVVLWYKVVHSMRFPRYKLSYFELSWFELSHSIAVHVCFMIENLHFVVKQKQNKKKKSTKHVPLKIDK